MAARSITVALRPAQKPAMAGAGKRGDMDDEISVLTRGEHGEHGKMKLYSVITTVKEYSGCKNVIFRWFREAMPQGQRPYADLIKDYEPGNPAFYATQVFVEELFTWDEAQQLKTYLDQRHEDQGNTVIKEATLPVENDICPVEVGDSFCMLFEEPEYSLPFKVVGLFNLDAAVKEAAAQMLDDVVAKYRERRRSARGHQAPL
jgi:hypothetical protein